MEEKADGVNVGNGNYFESREESPGDNQVDLVMRKLNFLDLASP